jgi:ATP-dependent helicase/nuclease subunit A
MSVTRNGNRRSQPSLFELVEAAEASEPIEPTAPPAASESAAQTLAPTAATASRHAPALAPIAPADPDAAARVYAVDPRQNVVLEASAGTGKTTVLVQRYLNLLGCGVDPANILAITFTRKAAAEMRERIILALRKAAAESNDGRVRWIALRDRLNDIAISTIDAFCYGLLREFPLEAGLDPAFTLSDETEVARLIEEALDHALRVCRGLAREDPDVALVFARLSSPRLRLGLSHLLERRLVAQPALQRYLTRGPVSLTVEEAVRRGVDRMRATLDGLPGGWIGWLAEGPCAHPRFQLLTADVRALHAGTITEAPMLAAVFDELRAYFLTKDGEPRRKVQGYKADHAPSKVSWKRHCDGIVACAPAVKQALDAWARDLNVILARGVRRMLAVALREYQRTLNEHGVVDFSEVLGRAVTLLRQMDEFSQSRYRLESRYHHVLVDEFQDTSRMQWELVSLLVKSWGEGFGLVHEAPLPPSLFLVGDRKQSIYRFRDADVGLLDEAASEIEGLRPDGEVRRYISRSFRAVPELLQFVNDVCTEVAEPSIRSGAFRYDERDRFPIDELTKNHASRAESAARAEGPASDDSADNVVRLRETPLRVIVADTIEHCAEDIALEIERILADGVVRDRETGVPRQALPGDIAILFRSRESHRELEDALDARGIPSYVYKGLGFFDADEIKDLSALLRYLAAPESNLRAAAFLRSRFVRLSDTGLLRLGTDLAHLLLSEAPVDQLDDEDRRVIAQLRA